MKKTILILAVAFFLFIIPIASAHNIYKQNTAVDLKVPCIDNNTYCSASAQCNITIKYPDESLLVDNALMTNKINYHNYTLTANQTNTIGIYNTHVVCIDDENGYSSFTYEITSLGYANKSFLENPILIFLIVIAFVILLFAGKMENLHLSFISGAIFGLIGVYIEIYGLNNVVDMYTRGLGMVFIALALYFIIVSAYELLEGYDEESEDIVEETTSNG